jgi:putative DNA primase/helicase
MNAKDSAARFPADASSYELNSRLTIRELAAEALEYHERVRMERCARTNARRAKARQVKSLQVTLDQTASRGVDWLWPGRIAAGRVTLLVGDPGLGKSLLALDIAARITNAQPWPDAPPNLSPIEQPASSIEHPLPSELAPRASKLASPPPSPNPTSEIPNPKTPATPQLAPSSSQLAPPPPASVLLLCAEDDIADTIRPRLEALGADLTRVIALPPEWSPDDASHAASPANQSAANEYVPSRRFRSPRPFDLLRDVPVLEDLVVRQGNVRLVVIDPLNAFLGNIENCAGPVRKVFRELAAMATRCDLAVLAISHLRKQNGSALHRTIGSLAFTAAARAAWLVAKDPHHPHRRLMLPIKNNLTRRGHGLAFTIQSSTTEDPMGEDHALQNTLLDCVPTLAWSAEPVTLAPDDALNPTKEPAPRPRPELDDAIRWLQNALAEGATRSRKIEVAAVAHGISEKTLRRAFRELGGEAVRTGFGPLSLWHWRLPGVGRQEPLPSNELPWED